MGQNILESFGVIVTRFSGDIGVGVCYQVNGHDGRYTQLTTLDAVSMAKAILKDVKERTKSAKGAKR